METIKFSTLNEARQGTIKYIIETKAKIKTLEESIKGMIEETKGFLATNKFGTVVNEDGVKMCYLKDRTQPPSVKAVLEAVKTKITAEDLKIIEAEVAKQTKESFNLMFG